VSHEFLLYAHGCSGLVQPRTICVTERVPPDFSPAGRGSPRQGAISSSTLTFLGQVDLASARESLCRGLRSRWFTERFHRNALVTHFQHGQAFYTARQWKDYAVPRCRLHQRAPQSQPPIPGVRGSHLQNRSGGLQFWRVWAEKGIPKASPTGSRGPGYGCLR